MAEFISVEIVYALKDNHDIEKLLIPVGTKLLEAILQSKTYSNHEELHDSELSYGVYSKVRDADYMLVANDRIEIYRPLKQDPKTRRENIVQEK